MVDDEQKELAYSNNQKLKSMLYVKYYLKYKTDKERMQHIAKGLSAEDWQQMLRYFGTREFKLRATKFGSGKKLVVHAGSTPFARLEFTEGNRRITICLRSLDDTAKDVQLR